MTKQQEYGQERREEKKNEQEPLVITQTVDTLTPPEMELIMNKEKEVEKI